MSDTQEWVGQVKAEIWEDVPLGTLRIYTEWFSWRESKALLESVPRITEQQARERLDAARKLNGFNIGNIYGVWIPDSVKL